MLCLAVGLTPLIFTTASRELFEFPKMVVVYGLAIVAVGLIVSRLMVQKKLLLPNKWISGSILIYVVVFMISTGLSVSIYSSVMGYYTRFHGGLASVVAYVALGWLTYIYATADGKDIKGLMNRLKPILYVWVGAASVVAGWGVLEHFGRDISCLLLTGTFDASCWVQDVQARVFATFGQPNWLATYLLTSLPLSLIFFIQEDKARRWLWLAATWVQFGALWYTYSRSAWIGLAAVGVIFILCLPWSFMRLAWRKLLVVGVGCAVISLSSFSMASQRTGTSLENGDFDSSTGQMRLLVWQGSGELIGKNPILGSGPETFAYSFLSTRPAGMNLTTEWNFLYNKAHNEVIQTATDRGLLGLLSLAGLWVVLLVGSWKSGLINRRQSVEAPRLLGTALMAGMVGVFVSQLFGFSVVMTGLLSWMGMLMMVALIDSRQSQGPAVEWRVGRKRMLWMGGFLSFLVLGLAGYGLISYTQAEILSTQASSSSVIDNQLNRAIHRAASLNPWEPYYQQQLAAHYASQAASSTQDEQRLAMASISLRYAEQAERLNPHNLITKKQLGGTYSQLGEINEDLGRAEIELWRRAVGLAATDAASWQSLAKVLTKHNLQTEAEQAWSRLIDLRPVAESYGQRASFFEQVGRVDEARMDLEKAAELEPWNNQWSNYSLDH